MTAIKHRCAVLGHPISHSLSPVLHNAAYAALGLDDWEYTRIDVEEDGFPNFLRSLDSSWVGLSLTMPLKKAALAKGLCRDEWSARLRVANTAVLDAHDGSISLYNTDVEGIRQSLPIRHTDSGATSFPQPSTVTIIGNGNTAMSALAAASELTDEGDVIVAARHPGRNTAMSDLASSLPAIRSLREMPLGATNALVDRLSDSDIVVSTLPAHAADTLAGRLRDANPRVTGSLLDVVYDPMPSDLLRAWSECGGNPISGDRMLLRQAVAQVLLMVGSTDAGKNVVDGCDIEALSHVMDDALTTALSAKNSHTKDDHEDGDDLNQKRMRT
ncbi:shikimate dehydrogenase [uncultured Bifidobacterium sp.]|uniref:shikimate dehydrogenase family protein n=1 Tax=uncultured Bifidobacterium sp. TaxID=165187 RepID=UPI0026106ABF|nr:shikimate dehydrogenase [uncultured Bifidobacterium sp.]